MSKVTIKFWDTVKNEYEDDQHWFSVDSNGDIVFIQDGPHYDGRSDGFLVQLITSGLKPHFYKNGERIA